MTGQGIEGKVAVVTGGGSGIGRATAKALARAGAVVSITGRRRAPLDEAVSEIEAAGGAATAFCADVSRDGDMERVVAEVVGRFGRLDIAFNNAGTLGELAALADMDGEAFDAVLATNLRGVWLSMKAEIAAMLKAGNGGAIIGTSSWLATGAVPGSSAYSASKAAVDAMTRAAALEYGAAGIRINTVAPGIIETPMTQAGFEDPALVRAFSAHAPLARTGTPDEVAEAVLWLAGDGARFVTGQSIAVDGGFLIPGYR